MATPDAWRVVAVMQNVHALRHIAPGHTVRAAILAIDPECAISMLAIACPDPAATEPSGA